MKFKRVVNLPHTPPDSITGATATTVYDVTQAPYSATGDGVTDDSGAIQSAINAANTAGGGIVHLPAATYLVDNFIQLKSGVKLRGAGMDSTTVKAGSGILSPEGPDFGHPLITTSGHNNVTISDLTADQSESLFTSAQIGGDRQDAYLIDIRSSNAIVERVRTRNPYTYSICARGASNFIIRNCDVRVETIGRWDQLDGIHIMESTYGWILYNEVDQRFNGAEDGDDAMVAHTIGNATCHDLVFAYNRARGGHRGNCMQLAIDDTDIYNIVIQNNEFWGGTEGIRTGWYGSQLGQCHDVQIGGANGKGNVIRDLVPGFSFPDGGESVWVFNAPTSGNLPTNFSVSWNYINAPTYEISVAANSGNVVANNTIV